MPSATPACQGNRDTTSMLLSFRVATAAPQASDDGWARIGAARLESSKHELRQGPRRWRGRACCQSRQRVTEASIIVNWVTIFGRVLRRGTSVKGADSL